eukprot:8026593-Pyramimonas_sp.AAC.1
MAGSARAHADCAACRLGVGERPRGGNRRQRPACDASFPPSALPLHRHDPPSTPMTTPVDFERSGG